MTFRANISSIVVSLVLLAVSPSSPVFCQQYYRDAVEQAAASRRKHIENLDMRGLPPDQLYTLLPPADAKDRPAQDIKNYADRIINVEMVVAERAYNLMHGGLTDQSADSDNLDKQLKTMKNELEREHIKVLSEKITLVRRQVVFSLQKLIDDIGSLASYSTSSTSTNVGPSRASAESYLKTACANKIKILTDNLEKDCWEIDLLFDKKMVELVRSQMNLKSQITARTGSNQVVKHGSDMYVHNYINFGGNATAQEPVYQQPKKSLMATADKLDKSSKKHPSR